MFHAVTLAAGLHDVRFVLAAAFVCVLAASAALWLRVQKLDDGGDASGLWLACGAVVAGAGAWAADLILFAGYQLVPPSALTAQVMAVSFLAAVLGGLLTLGGHRLALRHVKAGWAARTLSGMVLGFGLLIVNDVILLGINGWQASDLAWTSQATALIAAMAFGAASRLSGGDTQKLARTGTTAVLVCLAVAAAHFIPLAENASADGFIPAGAYQLVMRAEQAGLVASFSLLIVIAVGAMALVEAKAQQSGLRQLQTATNAMPAALALFDSNQRLVVWNTTFAQIAAAGANVRKGMSMEEMVRAMAPPGSPPRDAPERGERQTMEFPLPGGMWIRVENVPTEDGGLLSVGIDISEIKRSEAALAKALDRAEAANRAKSEFLANMSHEIRTPLNGVSGLADVLGRTRLDAQQRELVEIIRSSAQTVDALIGNILDLAAMESGQAQIGSAPFHLGELVRETAALHRADAQAKGLRLVEEIAAEAEAQVLGDAARLGQVLHNLLSNAVKFTEAGEVRVGVRPLGGDRFRLEVADTGVGFDPADRARLFDRFAQGDGSATRRFSGTGLGLALVGRCAQLMGASLDCSSTPGEGAAFTFDLRLPPAPAAGEAPRAAGPDARGEGSQPATLQVLVVDDNATNRRVLELILSQLGAKAQSVENGQEAVDACRAGRFDLILMDIQMPVMDGLTATRAIRAHERSEGLAATPVIIVSANCMPEHVQAGLEAGAQQCLGKPINAGALVDAISHVLSPSGQAAA